MLLPSPDKFREQYDYMAGCINPSDLTPQLFAYHLISPNEREDIENQMHSRHKSAVLLLNAVLMAIKRDTNNFARFVEILNSTPNYRIVASKLTIQQSGMGYFFKLIILM